MGRNIIDPALDKIAKQIVDAAFKVHYKLGPGLLEQIYETCLIKELKKKQLKVSRQAPCRLSMTGKSWNWVLGWTF